MSQAINFRALWCKCGHVPRGIPRGRNPRTPPSGNLLICPKSHIRSPPLCDPTRPCTPSHAPHTRKTKTEALNLKPEPPSQPPVDPTRSNALNPKPQPPSPKPETLNHTPETRTPSHNPYSTASQNISPKPTAPGSQSLKSIGCSSSTLPGNVLPRIS